MPGARSWRRWRAAGAGGGEGRAPLSLSLSVLVATSISLIAIARPCGGGEVTGPADDGAAVAVGRVHAGRWFPGTDGYGSWVLEADPFWSKAVGVATPVRLKQRTGCNQGRQQGWNNSKSQSFSRAGCIEWIVYTFFVQCQRSG
jgi:hypothetical protein